jgi:hypothetical protein
MVILMISGTIKGPLDIGVLEQWRNEKGKG